MKTGTETMCEQVAELVDLERRIIGSIEGFLTELRDTYETEATVIARRRLREVQFWLADEVATLTTVAKAVEKTAVQCSNCGAELGADELLAGAWCRECNGTSHSGRKLREEQRHKSAKNPPAGTITKAPSESVEKCAGCGCPIIVRTAALAEIWCAECHNVGRRD